jgi:hypothetical protein
MALLCLLTLVLWFCLRVRPSTFACFPPVAVLAVSLGRLSHGPKPSGAKSE